MNNERNQPLPTPSRIPDFATREEETEFWDTHDFTDYLDETRPVKLRVAKNLSDGVTVRLDPRDRAELDRRAQEQGVGSSTLIRMWIRERLHQTTSSNS
jgi:predicted HicB family RNase H-like nuclease